MSDFADVESQAKHLGYSIGDVVYEKKFEHEAEQIGAIHDIQDKDSIVLQKVFSYAEADQLPRVKISLDRLIASWTVQPKPQIPKQIASSQLRPDTVEVDKVRAMAYQELLRADKASMKGGDQGITFWANPSMIRSARLIPEGELTLLPMAPLAHIFFKNNKENILQQICEDPSLYILPVQKLKEEDGADGALAAPYWTVPNSATSTISEANIEETIIEKNGFEFKALTNSCEIKPFVQLQVCKAASKKDAITPLEGATLVTDDVKRRRITKSPNA